MKPYLETPNLKIISIGFCALRAEHRTTNSGDYWGSLGSAGSYLQTLAQRRQLQAVQLVATFGDDMKAYQPVLDYGCGAGLFAKEAVSKNIQTVACDVSRLESGVAPEFVKIERPWELPQGQFKTIVLNDVLEHCENLDLFIAQIESSEIEQIILKVPNRYGPLFITAEILAKWGFYKKLESLFLVGDVSPHVYYFSKAYLKHYFHRQGWLLKNSISLVEVGKELSLRMGRSEKKGLLKWPLQFLGACIGLVAQCGWSDTFALQFQKEKSKVA